MNNYISKYWSCYLSVGAIIISMVAIIIAAPRYTPVSIDYLGVIAGILSILVTTLLGWQIWTVISIDKKINDKIQELSKKIDVRFNNLASSFTDNINKTQESLRVSGTLSTAAALYKAESINLNVCLMTGNANYVEATGILSHIIEYASVLNDPQTLNTAAKALVDTIDIMVRTGIRAQDSEIIYNSFLKLSQHVLEILPASDDQVSRIYLMRNKIKDYLH